MSSIQHNDMAKLSSEPPRRGPWNQHEDEQLVAAAKLCSVGKWVEISQMIGHRTPKQCRERWYQNLKPDLNHNPITREEGDFIEDMVQNLGRKWAEIARNMTNRSDNAVKNWWNGGVNRRKRGEDKAASSAKIATLGPRTAGSKVQKKTGPRPHHHSSDLPSHHHVFNHYSMGGNVGGPHLPPLSVPHPNRHYDGNHPSPGSAAPSLVSDHPSHYSPSPTTSPAQYTGQYSHRSSIAYSRPSSSGYGAEPTVILPIPHNLSPISRPESYEAKGPSGFPSLLPHSIPPPDHSLTLAPILASSAQSSTAFSPVNGPSTESRFLPRPQMNMLNRPAPIMISSPSDAPGRRLSAVSTTPTAPSPRDRMSLTNLMD